MLNNKFCKAGLKSLALAMAVAYAQGSSAALSNYSQDFEGMSLAEPNALANDGWLVFGNVFNASGGYAYGYGPFVAPNDQPSGGFSDLTSGQGGAAQGTNQLNAYNDYNNTDHNNDGWKIESNLFQEQAGICACDVGKTVSFTFDAKLGDLDSPTEALAFIKTLDPSAGYATTNFVTQDMAVIPETWGTYNITLLIDDSLIGQTLQFGFNSTVTGTGSTPFTPSGVFYDNIDMTVIPVPAAVWLFGSGLLGLVGVARRKREG